MDNELIIDEFISELNKVGRIGYVQPHGVFPMKALIIYTTL